MRVPYGVAAAVAALCVCGAGNGQVAPAASGALGVVSIPDPEAYGMKRVANGVYSSVNVKDRCSADTKKEIDNPCGLILLAKAGTSTGVMLLPIFDLYEKADCIHCFWTVLNGELVTLPFNALLRIHDLDGLPYNDDGYESLAVIGLQEYRRECRGKSCVNINAFLGMGQSEKVFSPACRRTVWTIPVTVQGADFINDDVICSHKGLTAPKPD